MLLESKLNMKADNWIVFFLHSRLLRSAILVSCYCHCMLGVFCLVFLPLDYKQTLLAAVECGAIFTFCCICFCYIKHKHTQFFSSICYRSKRAYEISLQHPSKVIISLFVSHEKETYPSKVSVEIMRCCSTLPHSLCQPSNKKKKFKEWTKKKMLRAFFLFFMLFTGCLKKPVHHVIHNYKQQVLFRTVVQLLILITMQW